MPVGITSIYFTYSDFRCVSPDKHGCPEKRAYAAVLSQGRLYGLLNAKTSNPRNVDNAREYGAFKKEVCRRILFSDNRWASDHELWKIFEAEFPILANEIRDAKRTGAGRFACHLQSIESGIVIDTVASKFARTHAGEDVCIISMHDGFLTTERYVPELQQLLVTEYEKIIGFKPRVKIKKLDSVFEPPRGQLINEPEPPLHLLNPETGIYAPLLMRKHPVEVGDWDKESEF